MGVFAMHWLRRPYLLVAAALFLVSFLAAAPFLSTLSATIAISQSLSGALDLRDSPIVAITIPASWTAANLTFQGSMDNSTFVNVYNMYGEEFSVEAAASRHIVLGTQEFAWARYVKIRSGTAGTPVTQDAARTLVVVTRRVN